MTLPSLERPVHVVAEQELITQNYEWKEKKKKKCDTVEVVKKRRPKKGWLQNLNKTQKMGV